MIVELAAYSFNLNIDNTSTLSYFYKIEFFIKILSF